MKSILRNVFILFLISIIGTLLVSFSESIIPLIILALIIFFPGPDLKRPRLIRWIPYFWIYSIFESILILIDHVNGLNLFPRELYTVIKINDVIFTILSAPILTFIYYKSFKHLKYFIIGTSLISVALSVLEFTDSNRDMKSLIDLITQILSDSILVFYFNFKNF